MTVPWNMFAGWIGILLGMVTGAVLGLGFHRERFAGGYACWRRRLMRLGHISFFGLGFINLAFALSVEATTGGGHAARDWLRAASVLLVVGAVSMPTVCFLSAWRRGFRHVFFVPVLSLALGVVSFLIWGGASWKSV